MGVVEDCLRTLYQHFVRNIWQPLLGRAPISFSSRKLAVQVTGSFSSS